MDNKILNNQRCIIKKRIDLCSRNCNRTIIILLAFVICSSMFSVVIVEIYHEQIHNNAINKTKPVDIDRNLEAVGCSIENGTICTVTCSDMADSDIAIQVLRLPFVGCSSREIKLILKDIEFPDGYMFRGWLGNLSKNVQELTINSQFLYDIGESAFAGTPFEYLQGVYIIDSRIRYLSSKSFSESKIKIFEFRCISAQTKVEFNALGSVANYLTMLQFSNCVDDFQAIRNITGTGVSIFNKLLQIDIRYNTFNKIPNQSFIGTPQLLALYLSNNDIDSVEVEAFKGARSLQLLSLKDNKLTTLPNGIFASFTANGKIDISDNPWNCDCDLLWLKQFYIKNFESYFANGSISFTCTEGSFNDMEFCPNISTADGFNDITESIMVNTQTEQSDFTVLATDIPTEDIFGFIYLECLDLNSVNDTAVSNIQKLYSHQVKVRNGTIVYKFYQLEGQPNFELIFSKIENSIANEYLLWINGENSSDYGCVGNIDRTVQLNHLKYGNTYTICLLKDQAETVAPFDCTSLSVPVDWNHSAWIVNKNIPTVIGAIVGVTIGIIIITSIIIFYTIRQNPQLIKGNKRVVIVRNKSADALVMPNYTRQPYTSPSVYTNSEGYLTPRHKMYERINERRFRQMSAMSEKFYNDYHFNRGQAPSLYSETPHRRSISSAVYEPPPLPPNHPTLKKLQSRPFCVYK